MRRLVLQFVLFFVGWGTSVGRAEMSRGFDYVVIDGVKIPFGTPVEVTGQMGQHDFRDGCFVRGVRINGKANQDGIEFYLLGSRDDAAALWHSYGKDAWFTARGRLTDARTQGPWRACGLTFVTIAHAKPAPLGFEDFVDRTAAFDGMAAAGGIFKTADQEVRLEGLTAWPKSVLGKEISVSGTVRGSPNAWRIEHPEWKLIQLADQVDRQVSLEGFVYMRNWDWRFEYRGTKLYLTTARGTIMSFVDDDHGRRVRVTGHLVRQERPSLEQISRKTDSDLVPCFAVRGAKVEFLEEQVGWLFGVMYDGFPTKRDGVAELLAQEVFQNNVMGDETSAGSFRWRNDTLIEEVLADPTPKTLDVLAQRMNVATLKMPIRLLYAAMLARVNDARGRSFLVAAVERNEKDSIHDALFCLGEFPWLAPRQVEIKPEIKWAEKALIAVMTNREPANLTSLRFVPIPPDERLA